MTAGNGGHSSHRYWRERLRKRGHCFFLLCDENR